MDYFRPQLPRELEFDTDKWIAARESKDLIERERTSTREAPARTLTGRGANPTSAYLLPCD